MNSPPYLDQARPPKEAKTAEASEPGVGRVVGIDKVSMSLMLGGHVRCVLGLWVRSGQACMHPSFIPAGNVRPMHTHGHQLKRINQLNSTQESMSMSKAHHQANRSYQSDQDHHTSAQSPADGRRGWLVPIVDRHARRPLLLPVPLPPPPAAPAACRWRIRGPAAGILRSNWETGIDSWGVVDEREGSTLLELLGPKMNTMGRSINPSVLACVGRGAR